MTIDPNSYPPLIDPSQGVRLGPDSANAWPDLDEWGPDEFWSAYDWMTWHSAMAREFGIPQANAQFVFWWAKQSAGAAPILATWSDPDFRAYLDRHGLLGQVTNTTQRIIGGIGGAIGSVGEGLEVAAGFGPLLKLAVPIALGVWLLSTISGPVRAASGTVKTIRGFGR